MNRRKQIRRDLYHSVVTYFDCYEKSIGYILTHSIIWGKEWVDLMSEANPLLDNIHQEMLYRI